MAGARIAALAELKHSQIQNRPLPNGDTDNRTRPRGHRGGVGGVFRAGLGGTLAPN